MVPITAKLTPQQADDLRAVCSVEHCGPSELIRRLVVEKIQKVKPVVLTA